MQTAVADPQVRPDRGFDRNAALEHAMREFGDKVLHLAYFYLRDRQLAEDIAQETFIRVYRSWDSFRGESSVSTWVYRIAANLCRDRLRSKANSVVLSWTPPEPRETDPDPGDTVVDASQRREVLQAVLDLPDHYREVVALFYYQQLAVNEIADMLEESPGTIKSRLHRARSMLKDRLAGAMAGGEARS